MASKILIIDEQIFNEMLEMADHLLNGEVDSFNEDIDSLVPLAGHTASELTQALTDYEESGHDGEQLDGLAAITDGHIFCSAIRVWRELRKFY